MQVPSTATLIAIFSAGLLGTVQARNYGIMYTDVNAGGSSSDFASDNSGDCGE